jgi:hypothetical protein
MAYRGTALLTVLLYYADVSDGISGSKVTLRFHLQGEDNPENGDDNFPGKVGNYLHVVTTRRI